jgi:hypothetical protein
MTKQDAQALGALFALHHAGWIDAGQYEAGLMFADLWRHEDRHYVQLRNEIMVDLVKIDALDLATRVCRDNNIGAVFDRMPDLRHALNVIALRFKQVERAANESRRPAGLRAASVVADTVTAE